MPAEIGAFTGERIPLQPVERVHVTTLVDNVLDVFAADVGPAKRHPLGAWPRLPVAGDQRQAVVDNVVDGPAGEHGFSALVDVELAGGDWYRMLFDAGISPDGMVSNMGWLGLAPDSIELVVCSHGHFDHTTGLDGLARALGGHANLPVLIHPEFWSKRRIALPGREPFDMPVTSRSALRDVGFEIIERPEPSFLFGYSVLITGEVAGPRILRRAWPSTRRCATDHGSRTR